MAVKLSELKTQAISLGATLGYSENEVQDIAKDCGHRGKKATWQAVIETFQETITLQSSIQKSDVDGVDNTADCVVEEGAQGNDTVTTLSIESTTKTTNQEPTPKYDFDHYTQVMNQSNQDTIETLQSLSSDYRVSSDLLTRETHYIFHNESVNITFFLNLYRHEVIECYGVHKGNQISLGDFKRIVKKSTVFPISSTHNLFLDIADTYLKVYPTDTHPTAFTASNMTGYYLAFSQAKQKVGYYYKSTGEISHYREVNQDLVDDIKLMMCLEDFTTDEDSDTPQEINVVPDKCDIASIPREKESAFFLPYAVLLMGFMELLNITCIVVAGLIECFTLAVTWWVIPGISKVVNFLNRNLPIWSHYLSTNIPRWVEWCLQCQDDNDNTVNA